MTSQLTLTQASNAVLTAAVDYQSHRAASCTAAAWVRLDAAITAYLAAERRAEQNMHGPNDAEVLAWHVVVVTDKRIECAPGCDSAQTHLYEYRALDVNPNRT